ncbi:MAG TPA: amino acid adenylation domain-containing protein [Solirubrobacteraceae bacterium]|nr:amino acid adenylation domain-containing protein [Solirubrobacteraceae bacterium]
MANNISEQGAGGTIPRRDAAGAAALSFPQERLFLLDQIMPGLAAYNVPTLVRVHGRLDGELLREACERVVARHDILRTAIALRDGAPVQEVLAPERFELPVIDLSERPAAEAEAEAHAQLAELARRSFDLSGDVLLRAALVHLPGEQDLLLVVFHHVGSDHASSGLLFAELDAIYGALERGGEPELPELPIQYADYAAWQREQLAGPQLDELLEYWTEKLAGAPERLDLPTDRPRPSAQSYRGALKEFRVEPGVAAPLRDLARREGVSLFMVLLAAFKVLLHRYTGAEDLVVGAPVSGRRVEELSSLLGYFSNTLALRTDLSGDPSFSELLARVRETVLEAQIFADLPFEKLVEVLNPERAQSHSPIFQVLLGFDVVPSQTPQIAGRELEQLPIPGWQWARFDLSIVVRDRPDGALYAHLEYATDLFDAATIERLVGHLLTLLEAAAADPSRPLSHLPLMTEPERALVLEAWNDTSVPYDRRCLHELFAEQAAARPEAVAVVAAEGRITYGELDRASNRLARELAGLGAGPGTLVGLCVERSVDLVVALLGVLKTGAAYVPIEPTYPPERQAFMLADAAAPVLVTQEHLLGVIDARDAHVLCLDRDRERIAARSDAPLPVPADPEQLAYVIYTSGSTGRPKGVEIRHRSVANLVAHMRARPGLGAHDVVANVTTPAFDLSVPDWYLPLTTGARLVIVPREATLDGVELADWLARLGVTFMQATPTTWQLLLDSGWPGSAGMKIVCGGEALPRALADELLALGGELWHMYGPTETTVWSSILRLEPAAGPLALGGPIANTTFYVLDRHRRPCVIGVPGELYIGGEGVAVGYHDRPELTAERFVSLPELTGDERPLYRTGDLVRWREAGTLEFSGRIDHQVKLRGFRIELGEIEAVLGGHPSVAGAVVAVRELGPGDQRLVAYVVPAGETLDLESVRRLLKAKLPPFMLPSAFVTLQALPLTSNGKVDRGALPLPDGSGGRPQRSYEPPETPVQEALAEIWSEVLGLERIGIAEDFFDLGGHSLLAVKMLARVQQELGVSLPLAGLFDRSTIRELAEEVMVAMLDDATDDELASLLAD